MSTRCSDIEHLLSGYLDGELSEPDRVRVRAHLDSCADCRAGLDALGRAAKMIASPVPDVQPRRSWAEVSGEAAEAGRGQRPAVKLNGKDERRRRAQRPVFWPFAAAAAAAALAVVAVYFAGGAGAGTAAGGTVKWAEGALVARASAEERWQVYETGDAVPAGWLVRSRDGRSEVSLAGGVRLELNSGAEVRLDDETERARTVDLARGELCCAVPAGYGGFAVRTPAGSVKVTGTEFDVRLGEARRHAEVTTFRGAVKVSAAGRTAKVPAGRAVTTTTQAGPGETRRASVLDAASWRRAERVEDLARERLARFHSIPAMPEGERKVLCDFSRDSDVEAFYDSSTPRGRIRRTAELIVQADTHCQGTGAMSFPADTCLSSLAYANTRSLETDWSGWRWHRFEVYNPTLRKLNYQLLIKEAGGRDYEKRYNQYIWLDPGWNSVEVNLEQVAAGKLLREKGELGVPFDPAKAVHWVFAPLYKEGTEPPGLGEIKLVMDFIRLEERLPAGR